MACLPLEIKQEPDIKLEPEDEVDTIEYEQPLNQLDETFTVKVEKIESDNEADEVNKPSTYINRFGELVHNEQPCTSHIETYRNEMSPATVSRKGSAAKSNRRSTKIIEKTSNKRLAQKKLHKCSDCGYVAQSPSYLKVHMRKHTGEKPFPCASCDKRFKQKSALQNHLKTHVNKDSMHCSGCWQIFATKEEKLIHESNCKRRRYECFLCQAFQTSNITRLKVHMRIHSGVRPFQCDQCSMKFRQKNHLRSHMKSHSRPQKPRCSICARTFLKESEKDVHEINCTRRRYECYLCQSYMTHLKSCLQYHMRMKHTGELPFKCDSCEKCFGKKYNLKRHIKRSHKE